MAEPYLAEIRLMSFVFPPKGWALCNGQFLPINQNQALFSLLGTTYGGNGQTNFALPDLRGRVPIHEGAGFVLGERGGQEAHTLTQPELPIHTHPVAVSATATGGTASPNGAFLGGGNNAYRAGPGSTTFHPGSVTSVGGNQAHENRQPFLTLSFCIALQGIYPSQS
ncbi:phage tail protein [Nocardioides daeguensis]|uniref:Tail fiber protein n=1 Tax=Nocardioides daeguensis TaxID=908359 RepID=A0ABP6VPT7_9ACTN|nr:tail fiber protein [Nocardioides daeguensis]MBV6727452.1 tail fiber protein [Nocardioides daeguensis]MCR1773326.1 tail fiber protein [Nocardioides daeguensis]